MAAKDSTSPEERPVTPEEMRRNTDPEALLPGEDPNTPYLDDAHHWIRVYSQLLQLKHDVISRTDSAVAKMEQVAAEEAGFDQRLMRAQAARYEKRLAFWERLAGELSG